MLFHQNQNILKNLISHSKCIIEKIYPSTAFKDKFHPEAATGGFPQEEVFLKILEISQGRTCVGVSFLKETPPQVFSCEIREIFKNSYFEEYLRKEKEVSVKRNLKIQEIS